MSEIRDWGNEPPKEEEMPADSAANTAKDKDANDGPPPGWQPPGKLIEAIQGKNEQRYVELNTLAPESDKTVEELTAEGWEEFYSYREFDPNEARNDDHIKLALAEIARTVPLTLGSWELCRAKYADMPVKRDQQWTRALLKREKKDKS